MANAVTDEQAAAAHEPQQWMPSEQQNDWGGEWTGSTEDANALLESHFNSGAQSDNIDCAHATLNFPKPPQATSSPSFGRSTATAATFNKI